MPTRTSSAEWKGTLKEGAGTIKVGSGTFEGPYTFASRFESGRGTNEGNLLVRNAASAQPVTDELQLAPAGDEADVEGRRV